MREGRLRMGDDGNQEKRGWGIVESATWLAMSAAFPEFQHLFGLPGRVNFDQYVGELTRIHRARNFDNDMNHATYLILEGAGMPFWDRHAQQTPFSGPAHRSVTPAYHKGFEVGVP
ncbi:hypothetical protein B0H10DRAFT_1938002 [Mycena sp. CBHHK59/15]|nr:hypothetical protein B0H10DRAFT_1938002 [Mycena sp. CBHHK59/15]